MAPSSKAGKPSAAAKPAKKTVQPAVQPVAAAPVTAPQPAVKGSQPRSSAQLHSLPRPAVHPNGLTHLMENFRKFAAENPALAVVGIIAVTLAFILLLD